MKITIEKPDRKQFQILIGQDQKTAQWITLPCAEDISERDISDIRSPLLNIQMVYDISTLNEVAERVAELNNDELVKLKAVMELDHSQ